MSKTLDNKHAYQFCSYKGLSIIYYFWDDLPTGMSSSTGFFNHLQKGGKVLNWPSDQNKARDSQPSVWMWYDITGQDGTEHRAPSH